LILTLMFFLITSIAIAVEKHTRNVALTRTLSIPHVALTETYSIPYLASAVTNSIPHLACSLLIAGWNLCILRMEGFNSQIEAQSNNAE